MVDTDLYSRQIGAYGLETMGKLIQMKVLIKGLRGHGIEIAKNLILAGPKEVCIIDDTTCSMSDLGANFYLKPEDVGARTRCEATLQSL
jgi:ubiquitin-activating enzyme E1